MQFPNLRATHDPNCNIWDKDDWIALLVAIILAILLPWWIMVLIPFLPLILLWLICAFFRWK